MLTLGTYREKTPMLDKMRAYWQLPPMEFQPEKTAAREGTHHHAVNRVAIYQTVKSIIVKAFHGAGCKPWISLCKETHSVRAATDLCNANCNCLSETPVEQRFLKIYGASDPS